jgi:predicted dehydrogenase
MPAPLKLAIVGCGVITEDSHLPAALKSRAVAVSALVDRDESRAAAVARKFGLGAIAFGRLEDALAAADAAVIATPNHTHGALARIALERGIPVLLEKPLTTTHAEALELCDLAEAKRTVLATGFFTRHFPAVRLFKRLADEGFFGRIDRFEFEYGTSGGWAPVSGYNLDRRQSGGGVLVVTGTHFLDRMLHWFGEPSRFSYADDSRGGVEANCKAEVEFDGGLRGSLFFSKTIDLRNRLVVHAERYRAELPWGETGRWTLYPVDRPDLRMTLGDASGSAPPDHYFQVQLEDFAAACRDGTRPLVDGRDGARSVKLCEDFYAARTQLEEPWAWYRKTAPAAA